MHGHTTLSSHFMLFYLFTFFDSHCTGQCRYTTISRSRDKEIRLIKNRKRKSHETFYEKKNKHIAISTKERDNEPRTRRTMKRLVEKKERNGNEKEMKQNPTCGVEHDQNKKRQHTARLTRAR